MQKDGKTTKALQPQAKTEIIAISEQTLFSADPEGQIRTPSEIHMSNFDASYGGSRIP